MTTIEINKPDAVEPLVDTPAPRRARVGRPSLGKHTGLVIAFAAVIVYFWSTQSIFMTWGNIVNIVASNSVVLVLAIGATLVVISGGLDLSTSAATTAAGMAAGFALSHGASFIVAVLLTIGVGLGLGLVNGFLIAGLKMSFLVVTLGTMSVYSSIALVSHNGATIGVFSSAGFKPLSSFMTHKIIGVPYLMIFDVVLALLAGAVLRYTSYGRSLFAMGSNVEAARINGINVRRVEVSTYALAGLSAGIGGLIQVGRLSGAAPQVDATQLMAVLAAVLIGGTAFSGGEGGIFGTVIGVLFLGVISNGLTISEVSAFWQGAVNGGILLLAVLLSTARDRKWFRRKTKVLTTLTVAPVHAAATTG